MAMVANASDRAGKTPASFLREHPGARDKLDAELRARLGLAAPADAPQSAVA